jgi:hypothetical protein
MFGSDAPLNTFTGAITYTANGPSPIIHLLTDLPPNHSFQISAGGVSIGARTSSAQGTLIFTNASGSQVITIQ